MWPRRSTQPKASPTDRYDACVDAFDQASVLPESSTTLDGYVHPLTAEESADATKNCSIVVFTTQSCEDNTSEFGGDGSDCRVSLSGQYALEEVVTRSVGCTAGTQITVRAVMVKPIAAEPVVAKDGLRAREATREG